MAPDEAASDEPVADGAPAGGVLSDLSRRAFLRAGAVGAAVAGAASAVPGLSGMLGGGAAEAPAVTNAVEDAGVVGAGDVAGPIVAHINDASVGELSLYVGERQILVRDPALVGRIVRAAR